MAAVCPCGPALSVYMAGLLGNFGGTVNLGNKLCNRAGKKQARRGPCGAGIMDDSLGPGPAVWAGLVRPKYEVGATS